MLFSSQKVFFYIRPIGKQTEVEGGREEGGEEGRAAVGWLRLTRVSNFRQVVGNAIMRYGDKEAWIAHAEDVRSKRSLYFLLPLPIICPQWPLK